MNNHFCPRDGSAMEHLELRKEYICLLCGESQKEDEELKPKCTKHPNTDVTKIVCILKPCATCLHNELIQIDNSEAECPGDGYEL